MTVKLNLLFHFDCAPGEEKHVDVIAHAPLPAPMVQRFNLDRLVALSDGGAGLDDWEITALRVMDGQKIGDIISPVPTAPWTGQGPVPAAIFSCVAIGTQISAPFGPGDALTCVARNKSAVRAKMTITGVVRPRDWLFFCFGCGASVWRVNPYESDPLFLCDVCGGELYNYAPRDRDSGPWRDVLPRPWKAEDGRVRRHRP